MHRNRTQTPLKHRCALSCSKTPKEKKQMATDEVIFHWCSNGVSVQRLRGMHPSVWDAAMLKRLWARCFAVAQIWTQRHIGLLAFIICFSFAYFRKYSLSDEKWSLIATLICYKDIIRSMEIHTHTLKTRQLNTNKTWKEQHLIRGNCEGHFREKCYQSKTSCTGTAACL